ncbi:transposase DNA-binding-containing protein (plasmid) [Pseudomonas aeruginosa]|uniref:transposase DNA-binding-containing protein n=1 Tax=Pseudomonas aeruginosa TaxID=287 RepID=UPI00236436E3|nr:transposase DNA-binding-containing protein [Pseudomonas aeruginosa]
MLLASRLSSKPKESIPNACRGCAETQGAYRLLSNARTDWQALLKSHWPCAKSACVRARWR